MTDNLQNDSSENSSQNRLKAPRGRRLATIIFAANVGLLVITVLAVSVSQINNWMNGAREQALNTAEKTATQIADIYADIGEISIANVARTVDASLNAPMTAQAFASAFFVKVAEEAGYDTSQVINILTSITEETVLDEFWITDREAYSYLTNVRGEDGELIYFAFQESPIEQPQAYKFYSLLYVPPDSFAVVTQPAQVREVDRNVYKYVGTNGVDHHRITQVGNELVFGDNELLNQTHTDSTADVSSVIEGNLAANMRVVGVILDHYIEASNTAGRSVTSIEEDFGRIITHTAIGEIIIADRTGRVLHSVTSSGGERLNTVLYQDELDQLMADNWIDHSGAKIHRGDSSQYKYVTVARPGSDYIVQIGLPLVRGNSASILNTVYQEQADVLVREGYPEALWFNDSDNQIAAAAQYSEADDITEMESAWRMPYYDRSDSAAVLLERASATGQPASYARLGLVNSEHRGIYVATPISLGENRVGSILAFINLDDTAEEIWSGIRQTLFISLFLLIFTAVASFFGARLLTRPIEKIATAARFVESGEQPDEELVGSVVNRADEIGALARVFQDMTIQVFNREEVLETLVSERTAELVSANDELRLAQQAINQDLEMATVVQAALVREGTADLGSYTICARMEPAQQVGGDFVDFFEDGNSVICVVGDVSGKGVASALFMAASQAAIRFAANESSDIAEICESANNRLCHQNPMGLFVTVFIARVNLESGEVVYTLAGHEPPYLLSGGKRTTIARTNGIAMGVMDGIPYGTNSIQMKPGEYLFSYTDGLTDMINLNGDIYGRDRLEQALDNADTSNPDNLLNYVWDDIATFSYGTASADDRTCLILYRNLQSESKTT
ncbi:MAG: SpoIIE family protein phosphatase [Rhodothermaceae bacterium]|nr:SpoIIE family protein phosphatase [Rhodothermaceae bacterium]MXX57773.1 SpoIIE family protein phosphatase [Rhodothermaceae bacterium]MYD19398.1 SpoIIE family protein phosphatase [Rhodothermaceae bacterium]MYD56296.1 SpoIIE family protein phosphatase [Rhodothermaceae bacterium]MYI43065.1 SpoIIE family protein phosphatase [Rhodothermaceae bacterium]